jgi:hypothetical protein
MDVLPQFAGSAAAADYATSETDAVLDQGQQPGPSMRSNDETRQRIMTKFGSLGEAVIRAAAREFNALPESVRNWIDAPDEYGARLGNNENVVLALALRPFARLSPDAARAELERIRSGAAYAGGAPVAGCEGEDVEPRDRKRPAAGADRAAHARASRLRYAWR